MLLNPSNEGQESTAMRLFVFQALWGETKISLRKAATITLSKWDGRHEWRVVEIIFSSSRLVFLSERGLILSRVVKNTSSHYYDRIFVPDLQRWQVAAVPTGEVASSDSHIHPLDVSRFHLQQLDSSRSRTPTSLEQDASYMGYVCVSATADCRIIYEMIFFLNTLLAYHQPMIRLELNWQLTRLKCPSILNNV